MGLPTHTLVALAQTFITQVGPSARRRGGVATPASWTQRILSEPRNAVLIALFAVLAIGGGRKLLHSWKARGAVGRLGDADVTPEEIEAVARYGRAGLMELFRILGTASSESLRHAAGHAISILWAQDNLIIEEEKGLVLRGYLATWRARRRYPRSLQSPIPFRVEYQVPFLRRDEGGVTPENLEWSYQIVGARRAGLEKFSPWQSGGGSAEFQLYPGDFETNGPHKLALHARVRTFGLTDSWELDLPLIPFSFEFDPKLAPDALLALADATRAETISRSIRLESGHSDERSGSTFLPLNHQMSLRNPPTIVANTPLPCDLAHTIELEFEGVPGRFRAGQILLSGQGETGTPPGTSRSPISELTDALPADSIERPGARRVRAFLIPNPDLGWADPDIRSIWPGVVETDWIDAEVVRH